MFYIFIGLIFIPVLILFPTVIKGKKNIPKKGKMILCCNHQSNMDLPLIATRMRRRYKYLAKKELFSTRFKSWLFRVMGAYPIDRGKPDLKAVKNTLNFLKEEKAVCIFPEGTRLTSDEHNELKGGVAMFALKTDSPIVPCFIIKKPRPFIFNKIIIGKPFKFSDFEEFKDRKIDKELIERATEILSTKIYELKNYKRRK